MNLQTFKILKEEYGSNYLANKTIMVIVSCSDPDSSIVRQLLYYIMDYHVPATIRIPISPKYYYIDFENTYEKELFYWLFVVAKYEQ